MTSPESTSGSTSVEQRLTSIERAVRLMGTSKSASKLPQSKALRAADGASR